MNLDDEAEGTLKVAQYNFPNSPWTEKAEALMGVASSSDETDQKEVVGSIISRINIFK
jgi:outer membrane protein assembly factor BamD (BamD/ComL family)